MDDDDDGYFHYDVNYPPLYVKPPAHQENDFTATMKRAVLQYLQESYKIGIKHSQNITESGLSAGEAGVLYLRQITKKKKKQRNIQLFNQQKNRHLLDLLKRRMKQYMKIDTDKTASIWNKHVTVELLGCKQQKKVLLTAIKAYLAEINQKTKGYTLKLNNLINSLA